MSSRSRVSSVAGLVTAALLAPGCLDSSAGSDAGSDASDAPARLSAPTGLTAKAAPFRVRLSWTVPPGGKYDGFVISRNGSYVGEAGGTDVHYTDTNVDPKRRYVYQVTTAQGKKLSEPATAKVHTPVPPLASARLSGYFNVRLKLVSQNGYTNFDDHHDGWHFAPLCHEGPCNAVWADDSMRSIHARAVRHGAKYDISYNGYYFTSCNKANSTSSVRIAVHVTKARANFGSWIATRLQGTLTQDQVAQLGCGSAHASQKVLAKLTTSG